jgi:hypothetical protein
MKIFISWSGTRSKYIAANLAEFLTEVIQAVKPFVSAHDIEAGARWPMRLMEELEKTDFGILCLTPENLESRWVHFEAGALSKRVDASNICPYLHEITPTQIAWPLAQFQANSANRDGTLNVLKALNERMKQPLSENVLLRSFDRCWPELEQKLKTVPDARSDEKVSKALNLEEKIDEALKILRAEDRRTPSGSVPAELLSGFVPFTGRTHYRTHPVGGVPITLDSSIDLLMFDPFVRDRMHVLGLHRVGEVCKYTADELRSVLNLGDDFLDRTRSVLKAYGFRLRGE